MWTSLQYLLSTYIFNDSIKQMASSVHAHIRVHVSVFWAYVICVCRPPPCSGWPSDVSQDGVRLRQPQRRPVLLPRMRSSAEQPVSAPERPAHLRQRRHMGGELPTVPVPGKLWMNKLDPCRFMKFILLEFCQCFYSEL